MSIFEYFLHGFARFLIGFDKKLVTFWRFLRKVVFGSKMGVQKVKGKIKKIVEFRLPIVDFLGTTKNKRTRRKKERIRHRFTRINTDF